MRVSQRELAGLCGISEHALVNLERGTGNPTFDLIETVTEALGLELRLGPKVLEDVPAGCDRLRLCGAEMNLDVSTFVPGTNVENAVTLFLRSFGAGISGILSRAGRTADSAGWPRRRKSRTALSERGAR